jgi:hypothetical protein
LQLCLPARGEGGVHRCHPECRPELDHGTRYLSVKDAAAKRRLLWSSAITNLHRFN